MNASTGHNFINGARSAEGHSRLQSFDATTGQELPGYFTEATREEVDAAAYAAVAAYPLYRTLPPLRRAAFLDELTWQINAQPAHTLLNAGGLCNYSDGLTRLHDHPQIHHRAGNPQAGIQANPQLFEADAELLINHDELLQHEVFGPVVVVVAVNDRQQLQHALHGLQGQLTATLIAEPADLEIFAELIPVLELKAGRLLLNGYPTGVEVCDAMVHGGPYPATSDARGSSVGTLSINRFLRPICFQNYPDSLLPDALKNANPLGIQRMVDGASTNERLRDPVLR
jgi:alpha-ketoglutaric semialdehyde dehydrogenase